MEGSILDADFSHKGVIIPRRLTFLISAARLRFFSKICRSITEIRSTECSLPKV